MSFAAVDIGNSYIKIYPENTNPEKAVWCRSVSEAADACRKAGADRVAYCTTRTLTGEELDMAGEAGWWELRYGVRLPIEVKYDTPSTLGADRLAAAAGVRKLYPGQTVLTADLGTALTLDLISAAGEFLGGNISPGTGLRLRALHDYTSRLPLVESGEETGWIGHDTRTAILAGCENGPAYETAGTFLQARREKGCNLVVATGGGAGMLINCLKRLYGDEIPLAHEPGLVAEGLKLAYTLNHE